MLVVTRKVGERVFIGECVAIQVTEIRKGRVRIGIQAPAHLLIRRDDQNSHVASSQELLPVATAVSEVA